MSLDHALSRDISTCRFVLATDLDGTFLGGSDADRAELYRWIEAHRDSIGLIFVTGRDPAFIKELCDSGVPWPEFVVGDVGTTIARVHAGEIHPIAPLEQEIAETWGDAGPAVKRALDGHPGLTLQPTDFRYRVSYDMNAEAFDPSASEIVRELGHDPLISNNCYFDVLPRGISKGPSLRRLVSHLEIDEPRVLAAGDTLNDLSMLKCGLPAVAVGGSEEALLNEVGDLPHVHKARAVGAAGILEAVETWNMHPTPKGA
ncbi:HAD-IIB family hydrolase [Salipiger mucosus]|uniref:Alpha,alpha-trehalose-phosphate synthase (UDP-forming) n=1 Tax=Salipiger mucosus DSM 16094 TaxID=1123237 RepID=S9QAF8_9RHOB|nr:HAD-IIB family hydrolase [Salipiger mucosus]EPX78366.1 Alpha,alpha-trehalose-phosphate synthase (UDP-forming) [Salipiger mucosus DSM 16094]